MELISIGVAALFLPLFPFSMVFTWLIRAVRTPWLRFALLLLWPQLGIWLIELRAVPDALIVWALASSALYAIRILTVRDLGLWAAFLACSVWALMWPLLGSREPQANLSLYALWFSVPAALLALLAGSLTRRFGAAYSGLTAGLMGSMPRFSGALVVTVLAAIATPPFPSFFALLRIAQHSAFGVAIAALAIWLVWSWAGARLLLGFIAGTPCHDGVKDLARAKLLLYSGVVAAFSVAGIYAMRGGL